MNMDAVGGTRVRAGFRVCFTFAFGIRIWMGISHSLMVVGARGRLLKEVAMAPWPFVVVGTCDRSSIVVMGPCGHSSIVVVGSRSH